MRRSISPRWSSPPGNWSRDAAPLRYVAVRFTPRQSERFAAKGAGYHALVSNRTDLEAADLVRWHQQEAGTIEPVHRVMKDELGAGVPPGARFGANAAWVRINALVFNVLTVLKRRALPPRYHDARPKRLRYELFTLPGTLAIHQSPLSVRVPAADQRLGEIIEARGRLLAMHDDRRAAQCAAGGSDPLRDARAMPDPRTRPRRGIVAGTATLRAEL